MSTEQRKDPLLEIIAIEAKIKAREDAHASDVSVLKKDIEELQKTMAELKELLVFAKNTIKLVGYIEKVIIFCLKVSSFIGIFYAVYRFGLTELAEKIKGMPK